MEFKTPQGRLDSLHAAAVAGEGPVLVAVHDYPDPDCLAAALAAKQVLAGWRIPALIAYGGGIGRPENKAMIGLLEIDLALFERIDLAKCRGAVLVDSQPGAGNLSLPAGVPLLAVIDHHPVVENFPPSVPLCDIRPDYGSTSAIMLEYLETAGSEIAPVLATALFLGIRTDTDGLERDASRRDVEAYVKLLPAVDLKLAAKITHPPLTDEYFHMLSNALADACRFGEAVVANLGPVEVPDLLSAMSDLLVQSKGAAWALAVGWKDRKVYLSLRIRQPRRNAASIMRRTVGPEGRGGGHALAAGGQIVPAHGNCEAAAAQAERRFLEAVGVQAEPARQLVSGRRRRRRTAALPGLGQEQLPDES